MGFYSTAEDQAALMNSFRNMQQQNPQQPQRRSSLIASFLPTALSLAGGALGSVIAPGVGTAAGGASGAVLGKKLQDMMTGQHSGLGSYLGEAAFGSLGGLGKAFESVKGAGSAIKAGEGLADAGKVLRYGEQGAEALKAAPQALSIADKALAATEANAKGAYNTLHGLESGAANINNAGGLLGKLNTGLGKKADQALLSQSGGLSRGTADNAIRDVSKMRELGYTDLNKMAEHAPSITTKDGVLYNTREAMLAKGKPIDATTFKDMVSEKIGQNVALTPAEQKNISRLVENTTNKYKFAGEGGAFGQTSATNFNAAQRDIMNAAYKAAPNSAARQTLMDIGNDMRTPLSQSLSGVKFGTTEKQAILDGLAQRGIKNPALTKAIQNAQSGADLASIESPFVTASNMAKEGAANELRTGAKMFNPDKRKITGMANEAIGSVVGAPVRKATTAGTNLLTKLTGMGAEKVLPTTVEGIAGNAAKSMAKVQLPVRFMTGQYSQTDPASAQPNDIMQTNPDGSMSPAMPGQTNDTFSMSDPTAQVPPTNTNGYDPTVSKPEDISSQLMTAAQHALAAGDTKGLDNIMKVASLYQAQQKLDSTTGSNQKLSAAQQARKDALTSAFATLDAAPANLASGGGAKGVKGELGKTPWLGKYLDPQAAAYTNTKIEMATQLAKALTGGSRAPQNVINYYMNSLPDVNDPPEYAAAKLNKLRAELTSQANRFGYTDITGGADTGNTDIQSSSLLNRLTGA